MVLSLGGAVKSSQGGMAMGELLMLLLCRKTQARALWLPTPTGRDALLQLMLTTLLPEAMVAKGQKTWAPETTSITTDDPTCSPGHSSPKITKSGPPSTSLVQPAQWRSRSYNQAVRHLGPSNTMRDHITLCHLLSVLEKLLTTESATVMYATFSSNR